MITASAAIGIALWAGQAPPAPRAVRIPEPAPTEPDARQRGRAVYERYGCAMCHGADGKGGFANPNAETEGKVPGVLYVAEGYTVKELRAKILDGQALVGRADPKGPRPPFRMPGWKGYLTPQEADDLVQYLMSLMPKSEGERWR